MKINIGGLEISAIIKAKSEPIKNKVTNNFLDTDLFKRFYVVLNTLYKKNNNIDDIAIFITKSDLLKTGSKLKDQINSFFSSPILRGKHYFWVNENLEVVSSRRKNLYSNNAIRRFFKTESSNYCIFYLSKDDGIHYFIDGEDVGESIFFTSTERAKHNRLLPISEIDKLFTDYRNHLEKRNTYSKFFVSNSGKRSLAKHLDPTIQTSLQFKKFQNEHEQLLNNSPETYFRDDLKDFLDKNLSAHSIAIEYMLTNLRRLDIAIVDDLGEKYLIEVKWVGRSIHRNGDNFGSSMDHKNINPDAVIQSVEYIQQLDKEKKNIKIAFLAVFDARYTSSSDTVASFDTGNLGDDLKRCYSKFEKIPDFIIKNVHPK